MGVLGFTTVTFRNLSRREVCETAKKNGIEYLEWGGDVHLPPDDSEALEEVLSLQKEFGIKALSYGSYYRLGDKNYDIWKKTVDTADRIGAGIIRIWQGCCGSAETSDCVLADMVEETRKLADIAAEKNITVAFEFHKRTNNDCCESCINFLEKVDRSNVKTYWQPFSVHSDNAMLRRVLPYVCTVHVFTWRKDGERYSLKHGEKKWKNFIRTIEEGNSSPNFIMEFVKNDSTEQFARDVKTLKEWLLKESRQ